MQKADTQRTQSQNEPATWQAKSASHESPQGEQITQLEALIDASPAMAVQRKLIETIHDSPLQTAQRQRLERMFGADQPQPILRQAEKEEAPQRAATPTKPNNTGLPDSLKSGIESLSGLSMDNVRVHYNSSQPAQLNAHAYAQGTDIHLAPGQERHLPHEAWHVVQQAQGRVQPTMQMKRGVPVNDDTSLEQEADVMGAQAAQFQRVSPEARLLSGPANTGASHRAQPIQREKVWARKPEPGDMDQQLAQTIYDVIDKVDMVTQEARNIALNWRNLINHPEGQVQNWVNQAQKYSEVNEPFPQLYMSFGTAVENLACSQLGQNESGLIVILQLNKGTTIPDIVLVNPDDKQEVAWLDITASDSETHIDKKVGSGWSTKPFVAEITYISLNPQEVITNSNNPVYNRIGQYQSDVQDIRLSEYEHQLGYVTRDFGELLDKSAMDFGSTRGNQQTKSTETNSFLHESVGFDTGRNWKAPAKGALKEMGFNPGHFGLGSGKQDSAPFKSFLWGVSEPGIEIEMGELHNQMRQEFQPDLNRHQYFGLGRTLKQDPEFSGGHGIKKMMAVQEVLQLKEQLQAVYLRLKTLRNPHSSNVVHKLIESITMAPDESLDIDILAAWAEKTQHAIAEAQQFL